MSSQFRNVARSLGGLALTVLFVSLFGCKQSTAPKTTPDTTITTVTHASGEFGWVYNSTTIDRKNFWSGTSSGSAAYTNFGAGSSHQLDVTLTVYPESGVTTTVELLMPMPTPRMGKIPVATTTDLTNASISLKFDTARYQSEAGGTLEITKFDTVNNTVSGTFSFDGKDGSNIEHVTAGYFTDMPIYYGAFNPGIVTASVNGALFTSQNAQVSPSLYTTDSGQTMILQINGDNNGDITKSIAFGIEAPKAGYYYDLNGDARWYGAFVESGTPVININSMSGAVGRLTITNFDWVTHRISGTFYLSGIDQNGDFINVQNGVINNVQWFSL